MRSRPALLKADISPGEQSKLRGRTETRSGSCPPLSALPQRRLGSRNFTSPEPPLLSRPRRVLHAMVSLSVPSISVKRRAFCPHRGGFRLTSYLGIIYPLQPRPVNPAGFSLSSMLDSAPLPDRLQGSNLTSTPLCLPTGVPFAGSGSFRKIKPRSGSSFLTSAHHTRSECWTLHEETTLHGNKET